MLDYFKTTLSALDDNALVYISNFYHWNGLCKVFIHYLNFSCQVICLYADNVDPDQSAHLPSLIREPHCLLQSQLDRILLISGTMLLLDRTPRMHWLIWSYTVHISQVIQHNAVFDQIGVELVVMYIMYEL